jgi:hypothetical protein
MSNFLRFSRAIRVPDENGVLTDADTMEISIIRTDTSAEVVATTPMLHDSTGTYHYDLTNPVAGKTYRATYHLVLSTPFAFDGTFQSEKLASAESASCDYITSYEKFLRRWGRKNVAIVSNKDVVDPDNPDVAVVQDAFDFAVYEINKQMRGGIYKVPILPSNDNIDLSVEEWAMVVAYCYMYYGRFDDNPQIVDSVYVPNNTARVISKLQAQVYTDMSLARNGHIQISSDYAATGSMRPKVITDLDIFQSESYQLANNYRLPMLA